jgi:uncharacterized protein (DUF2236 family)
MSAVLPERELWPSLAPTPGSPVWRAFNDSRMLSTSLYATLLQVAHPTVGSGVHQYSSFTKDPWGRLLRTLDYVHGTIYGGPELAGSIGARVRGMHRTIRGVRDDGARYSAMEPDAFAWVHATLAAAIFAGHEHFATPMTGYERQAVWTQWLEVGRFIGIRERDLPADIAGFDAYFERVTREELRWTPAVPEVMASLAGAPPPRIPGLGPRAWRLLATPASRHLRVVTAGLLTPGLRRRLGLPLTRGDRALFRAHCAVARRLGPLQRGPLAEFGPLYVRWRHTALQRGEVASGRVSERPALPV